MPRQTSMAFAGGILTLLYALSAAGQDGSLVDLGTHKLNIVCAGSAGARPVVILEAGGGGSSVSWKAVQAALPPAIRACAYDRAGSGKSDPGPEPPAMSAEVADLHALLERSGIPQPIVFVGQSLGGILARLYVHEYPDSVAGVLLIDPTDENDVVFNTRANRWITVRELEGPLGDGARSAEATVGADQPPVGPLGLCGDRGSSRAGPVRGGCGFERHSRPPAARQQISGRLRDEADRRWFLSDHSRPG